MPDGMRRFLKALVIVLVVILVAGIAGAFWARGRLRGSLPQLEGSHQVAGLTAQVSIQRDGLGIPSIRGATREDVALMRAHCLPEVQIKASGGIHDRESLLAFRALGATRIGTSRTRDILGHDKAR